MKDSIAAAAAQQIRPEEIGELYSRVRRLEARTARLRTLIACTPGSSLIRGLLYTVLAGIVYLEAIHKKNEFNVCVNTPQHELTLSADDLKTYCMGKLIPKKFSDIQKDAQGMVKVLVDGVLDDSVHKVKAEKCFEKQKRQKIGESALSPECE